MGLDLPREPKRGDEITAAWGTRVVRCLRALEWKSSPSLDVTTLPSGTTGKVRRASGGGGATIIPPFTPEDASEGETLKISFTPGLVDRFIPTIDGVSLASFTGAPPAPPKITVAGAEGQVWIKNTLDAAGTITESIIETGAALPADTETIAYRPLATFTTDEGAFTSLVGLLNTNQNHKRCGGVSTWGS